MVPCACQLFENVRASQNTAHLNAFTSYKFTTTLFEEMAFGGQRTVMAVATVITPHTEFACYCVSKKVAGRRPGYRTFVDGWARSLLGVEADFSKVFRF